MLRVLVHYGVTSPLLSTSHIISEQLLKLMGGILPEMRPMYRDVQRFFKSAKSVWVPKKAEVLIKCEGLLSKPFKFLFSELPVF